MQPNSYKQQNYGLNQALNLGSPLPVLAKRAPTTKDLGFQLGTLWLFVASNLAWVLTSSVGGVATWLEITSSGGSGAFTTLSSTGATNLATTSGAVNIATTGTGLVSIGNAAGIDLFGNTISTGTMAATTFYASGDAGGVAATTALTDGTAPAGGTGALTILSSTGSTAHTNAGFIKVYVGTTAAYIPYYTAID